MNVRYGFSFGRVVGVASFVGVILLAFYLILDPHLAANDALRADLRAAGIGLLLGVVSSVFASGIWSLATGGMQHEARERLEKDIRATVESAVREQSRIRPPIIFFIKHDIPLPEFSSYWNPILAQSKSLVISAQSAVVFGLRVERMMKLDQWKAKWVPKERICLHIPDPRTSDPAHQNRLLSTLRRLQELSKLHSRKFARTIQVFVDPSAGNPGIELADAGVMVSFLKGTDAYAECYFAWEKDTEIFQQIRLKLERTQTNTRAVLQIVDGKASGSHEKLVAALSEATVKQVPTKSATSTEIEGEVLAFEDSIQKNMNTIVPETPPIA